MQRPRGWLLLGYLAVNVVVLLRGMQEGILVGMLLMAVGRCR